VGEKGGWGRRGNCGWGARYKKKSRIERHSEEGGGVRGAALRRVGNTDIYCIKDLHVEVNICLGLFFFKQKTAYEISTCLEFRRVLFRSPARASAKVRNPLLTQVCEPGSNSSSRS